MILKVISKLSITVCKNEPKLQFVYLYNNAIIKLLYFLSSYIYILFYIAFSIVYTLPTILADREQTRNNISFTDKAFNLYFIGIFFILDYKHSIKCNRLKLTHIELLIYNMFLFVFSHIIKMEDPQQQLTWSTKYILSLPDFLKMKPIFKNYIILPSKSWPCNLLNSCWIARPVITVDALFAGLFI